jgi:hypothetical protein
LSPPCHAGRAAGCHDAASARLLAFWVIFAQEEANEHTDGGGCGGGMMDSMQQEITALDTALEQ